MAEPATTYLRIAFLGATPLLVMLATTGVLRGLQDTRTPLVAAVGGNALNIVLNLLLVYGVRAGFDGSEWPARPWARCLPSRQRRGPAVRGRPRGPPRGRRPPSGPPRHPPAAHAGVALVIRTLTLRAALL